MKDNVIQYHVYKPHVVLRGRGSVHVIPKSCFHKIISGEMKVSDIEDMDDWMPSLISEWLEGISNEG